MTTRHRAAKTKNTRGNSRRKPARKPVVVKLNRRPAVLQPSETFRVCPLGLQFYSPEKVSDFKVMNFRMQMGPSGGASSEVSCSGVVVHCQKEKDSGLFRVWVKFLDLAEDKGSQLKCAAKDADAICPHCENF